MPGRKALALDDAQGLFEFQGLAERDHQSPPRVAWSHMPLIDSPARIRDMSCPRPAGRAAAPRTRTEDHYDEHPQCPSLLGRVPWMVWAGIL